VSAGTQPGSFAHARNKTAENVRLVPVVLELWTVDDVEAQLDRVPASERLLTRCIRLHEQAHEQGALLSNVDLAGMLGVSESRIGSLLAAHEREHQVVIPRRATLHDVGSGVTHKRIICWKRYVDGKSPEVIAHETHHSLTAVDRYLGMFNRVRCCRKEQMPPHEIARVLGCTSASSANISTSTLSCLEVSHELHLPSTQSRGQSSRRPGG
jgi:hypothetical protein